MVTVPVPRTGERLPVAAKLALVLEIVRAYRRVRRLLRRSNLGETLATLRSGGPDPDPSPAGAYEAALRLASTVCRVLAVVPGDSRCLARSLVLAELLARRGLPASLVIAVRSRPFGAHAWLELAGRPLLPPAGPPFRRFFEV